MMIKVFGYQSEFIVEECLKVSVILSEFIDHFLVGNFILKPLRLQFEAEHRNNSPPLPVVLHPRSRPLKLRCGNRSRER